MKLEFDFKSQAQVAELIQWSGEHFAVFVPTVERVRVGDRVHLDLTLSGAARVFPVSGRVSWVRYSGLGTSLMPGISLECDRGAAATLINLTTAAETHDFNHTRRFPRHTVSTPVLIHIQGPDGKQTRPGNLADLSLGGAFVALPADNLPSDTQFSIELLTRSLPFLRPKLGARVCWTGRLAGQSGVGARFVEFGGGAREALARMLSHS
jgi:Tfp pilus assembly protein PilZ